MTMLPLDPHSLPLQGTAVIEASAGTGKTYTITSLVLRLLLERKLPIAQILVVTYTRAATAELRQRIRARLLTAQRIIRGEALDDPFCQALCHDVRADIGQEQLQELIERALADVDEAPVLTIHGFCQRTLSEHAFESGSGLRLEVTTSAAPMMAEIADDFFTSRLFDASPEEVRPLLGEPDKLRTLAARAGSDEALRVLPDVVQAADYEASRWERAHARCTELWQRERQAIVAQVATLSRASTHVASWSEQWENVLAQRAPGATRTLTPACRDYFTLSGSRTKTKKGQPPPEHPFLEAAEELVQLDAAFEVQNTQTRILFRRDFLSFLRTEVRRKSREHGVLTFDALLTELHAALQGTLSASLVAALRKRYRAALVDEFQDTDPVQYEIFRTLFGHDQGCLLLIGDPKQAIYGFRGADVLAYLKARNDAGQQVYTLDTNRRSDPSLIDALNRLYTNVKLPFALQRILYQPVRPPEGLSDRFAQRDGRGALDFLLLAGEARKAPAEKDICNALALDVAQLLVSDCELHQGGEGPRRVRRSDIAVLCRTNKQALAMQLALTQVGVPSVFQGDETVFRSEDADAVERLLEALVHPNDAGILRSFLCSWYGGYTAQDLCALEEDDTKWEKHRSVFAALHETFLQRGFMQAVRGLMMHYLVEQHLLRRPDGTRRITNLWHLIELLATASIAQRLGPLGLLRWYRIVRADETRRAELVGEDHEVRLESSENAVKLTTVHKSKGLEYPIVYCPFLWAADEPRGNDKEFVRFHDPKHDHALTLDLGSDDQAAHLALFSEETLAEGLRLLYVALTRAKHRLCVAIPQTKGFAKSALGYTLLGGGSRAEVEAIFDALGEGGFETHVHGLVQRIGGAISVRRPVNEAVPPQAPNPHAALELRARAIKRSLDQSRRVSSFSGLSASRSGAHAEIGRDHDALAQETLTDEVALSPHVLDAFPRGAAAGELVHEVLEHADFQASQESLQETAESVLLSRGYNRTLSSILSQGLFDVLHTPLEPGLTLSSIDRKARVDEMEFVLPVTSTLTPQVLERAFREHRAPSAMPTYASELRELSFDKLVGYLRGFIDLVFRHEGRYYLVDYKSNWLGAATAAYGSASLVRAMNDHHYFLQYHLYAVALHRHLRLRVHGYDYDSHFGGVFYLFLRGMSPEHPFQTGVFFDRPTHALVTTLERVLGSTGDSPASRVQP